MAYENLKLVCALMSGDIYLTRVNKDNTMSLSNRRVITDEVLIAATEWFIKNKKSNIRFEQDNHALFYTNDPEKIDKIKEILKD